MSYVAETGLHLLEVYDGLDEDEVRRLVRIVSATDVKKARQIIDENFAEAVDFLVATPASKARKKFAGQVHFDTIVVTAMWAGALACEYIAERQDNYELRVGSSYRNMTYAMAWRSFRSSMGHGRSPLRIFPRDEALLGSIARGDVFRRELTRLSVSVRTIDINNYCSAHDKENQRSRLSTYNFVDQQRKPRARTAAPR